MFTGIVEEVGVVRTLDVADGRARLVIECAEVVRDARVGDSISVDGCCLTIAERTHDGFVAELMGETLRVTALGDLRVGGGVNLEAAMRADGRFGGHLVQGHVDGVGEVVAVEHGHGSVLVDVRVPENLRHYLVAKGSLTLAGASLTIVEVSGDTVRIGLIPHTLEHTTFAALEAGARINLEVDVIAKYVERMLEAGVRSPYLTDEPEDAA